MKAHLMYRDRDFDFEGELPHNEADLRQDLGLDQVLRTMAAGDTFLFEVARHALLSSVREPAAIAYRQDVLRDCVDHPDLEPERL